MEDICAMYLIKSCNKETCSNAHSVDGLVHADNWVLFARPDLQNADFLASEVSSNPSFTSIHLPGHGLLVRMPSPEAAQTALVELEQEMPKLLKDIKDLSCLCVSETTEKERATRSTSSDSESLNPETSSEASASGDSSKQEGSVLTSLSSTEDVSWSSSLGPVGSWADEVDASSIADSEEIEERMNDSELATTPEFGTPPSVSPADSPARPARRGGSKRNPNNRGQANGGLSRGGYRHMPHHTSVDSCTDAALHILRTNEAARFKCKTGWEALKTIWNLGPHNLDTAVLACLNSKTARQQEHILLSFAAIDLSNVKNLSAYLNCLIKEHETTNQVCLYFLAGLCCDCECPWVHPVNTRGWNALNERWGITYQALDYTVLNFLSKKVIEEQDNILLSLADMDLRSIHNLSAYLSSMIQKHDHHHSVQRKGTFQKGHHRQQRGGSRGGNVDGQRYHDQMCGMPMQPYYHPVPLWYPHPHMHGPPQMWYDEVAY